MKQTTLAIFAVVAGLTSWTALASPQCTQVEQGAWIPQDQAQQQIQEMGYKIKKFKVTRKQCYEIYGWNDQGKRVEIYFDPTDLRKVKEEIDG